MKNLIAIFLTAAIFISLSCKTKQNGDMANLLDTTKIIEFGVEFLYKTRVFAPSFYSAPVKLVSSKFVPGSTQFMINGRNCLVVKGAERASQRGFYQSPTENPEPFFEIYDLILSKDGLTIEMEINVPSVGSQYRLKIRRKQAEKFQVTQVLGSKT